MKWMLTGMGWGAVLLGLVPAAQGMQRPTETDVRYGDHPRNRLDFYAARGPEAAPVLIYFHGGWFVEGDKSMVRGVKIAEEARRMGIHVVSANYRFVAGADAEPFPGSLMDGVRVIQYVRHRAAEWGIDPERVVLSGGSAGACMSIWAAVQDDLAEPGSDDAVARESSRVLGVIAYGGQTTLNPFVVRKEIGGNPRVHPSLYPLYGVAKLEDLEMPDLKAKMDAFSALSEASEDDPPLFLSYGGQLHDAPLPENASVGKSIHHARFGTLMREAYEKAGAEAPVLVVCKDCPDAGAAELEFLLRLLGEDRR